MTTQAATSKSKANKNKRYTVAEYIAFEETAELRHEFTDGKLTAMAGTSGKHNKICILITFLLMKQLKGCDVFMENVKLQLAENKRYVYPDVFVTCDAEDLKNEYIKANPSLIVEVTSESTRVYDRSDKFLEYKKLKSLDHYILVDQYLCLVEYFFKNKKGVWEMKIYTNMEDNIELEGIDVRLPLSDIYPAS